MKIKKSKQKNVVKFCSLFSLLLLFLLQLSYSTQTIAQQQFISISMKNASLHEILLEIKKQSGKNIVYNNNLIEKYNKESIDFKNAKLEDALEKVLDGKSLNYKIVDDVIIIEPKPEKPNSDKPAGLFQIVKGTVFDIETNTPLIGSTVAILETNPVKGTATDLEGNFKLEKVPVGRYNIQVSYVGYEPVIISEVLVTSGKEVVLNIGLKQSSTQLNEVTVKAYSQKDQPLNSMASISARSFSVEEARRYAGGLDDPARLASSFAGVAMSTLTDNGIVIRGNSAKGVSWRLEGIDIPNPNHFAGANVAGGGIVTVFSSQMLANSDFYTGAFPAEYGNALAGVFDMKFRTGNTEKREYTFQAGVIGIDLSSEGPFKEGDKATYLFNYRYSTFGLIKPFLPMNTGIPDYQDLSFKLNFPNKTGSISVWGIGSIDNMKQPKVDDSSKWETAGDRWFFDWHLKMGAIGVTNKIILGKQTYINTTIAGTGTLNGIDNRRYDDNMVPQPNWLLTDNSSKIVFSSFINHKLNEKTVLKTGFNFHTLFYNLNLNSTINDVPSTFQNFVKENGSGNLVEYYAQSKYDVTKNLTLFLGINTMYFLLNKDYSFDPRASLKWQFNSKHSLSFGFGKHSQIEELKIYMVNKNVNGKIEHLNKNLEMSHSLQYVLGYDWLINDNVRLKVESYFQHLYNVPGIPDSSYSLINFTQDWSFRDSLANNSKGQNFGVDFTLERFLQNGFYYLFTASIFKSRYQDPKGIWRDTRFDRRFLANFLFGKEFNLRNNKVLSVNAKFYIMGGDKESPVDGVKTKQFRSIYFDETKAFTKQMPTTQFADLTITYRINKPGHSSVWALQIKNVTGAPFYSGYAYYYKTGKISNEGTVVVLPLLSYKIEF
jgi:hypothetical protein